MRQTPMFVWKHPWLMSLCASLLLAAGCSDEVRHEALGTQRQRLTCPTLGVAGGTMGLTYQQYSNEPYSYGFDVSPPSLAKVLQRWHAFPYPMFPGATVMSVGSSGLDFDISAAATVPAGVHMLHSFGFDPLDSDFRLKLDATVQEPATNGRQQFVLGGRTLSDGPNRVFGLLWDPSNNSLDIWDIDDRKAIASTQQTLTCTIPTSQPYSLDLTLEYHHDASSGPTLTATALVDGHQCWDVTPVSLDLTHKLGFSPA